MYTGKNDIVNYTLLKNDFEGHRKILHASELGFMPILIFDVKNGKVKEVATKNKKVLAEPVLRVTKYNQWVRLDFEKFR